MDLAKERIEHLAKEIETVTIIQMTFRTRMGFTVLVGPFIVMGSVLLATKGKVTAPTLDVWFVGSAILAVVSYLGLAWYGAKLDKLMSKKCNEWRAAILDLCKDIEPANDKIMFPQERTLAAYWLAFALVLIAFLSIAYCLFRVLPG